MKPTSSSNNNNTSCSNNNNNTTNNICCSNNNNNNSSNSCSSNNNNYSCSNSSTIITIIAVYCKCEELLNVQLLVRWETLKSFVVNFTNRIDTEQTDIYHKRDIINN